MPQHLRTGFSNLTPTVYKHRSKHFCCLDEIFIATVKFLYTIVKFIYTTVKFSANKSKLSAWKIDFQKCIEPQKI